ncbi:FAD-dependent oxidoreductase [Burkholderia alba]|uniref:FAD-dependent oxidoreductase n=1 Tax=Burkholderia alba TaxID=2683677 RepID=UPI002B0571F4|nr:FAD-dependent oxidoreductase [Burkholderia alba]
MIERHDIVIVGAGPAGLAAARAAAHAGARIAVLDDNPLPGGQVWRQGPAHAAAAPLSDALRALARLPNVEVRSRTRVAAVLPGRVLLAETDAPGGRMLGYERLVLATGARERLLPFGGWTLPGVTGAGGLQALIKGGVPVRGERIVIAGSGPLLIASLATARAAGATVVAVIEQATPAALARFGLSLAATPSKLVQAARLTRGFVGTEYLTGSVVREVHGDGRVRAAVVETGNGYRTINCDRVACGFGLVPNTQLARALGCEVRDGAIVVDERQRTSVDAIYAAGEGTGIGGMELASVEGELAGWAASAAPDADWRSPRIARLLRRRDTWRRFAARVARAFELGAAARALPDDGTILCRCEDVTVGAVRAHASARDAKLQTRCGMGACQGRVCGAALTTYFDWDDATPRPPFVPVRIDTLCAASDDALL